MECKNVLLLFVFQSITAFSTEEKSISASHSSYFETHGNKQLLGYVVKRFDSPSLLSCGHECLRNSWCTSTNFRLGSSMEEDEGICELNKHNISVINDDTHFAEQEGITFSILLKVMKCMLLSSISHMQTSHNNMRVKCLWAKLSFLESFKQSVIVPSIFAAGFLHVSFGLFHSFASQRIKFN